MNPPLIIKSIYNDMMRRFTMEQTLTFQELKDKLMLVHSLPTDKYLRMSYKDQDGDDITFDTEEEWKQVVESSEGTLKVTLQLGLDSAELETIVDRLVQANVTDFTGEMQKSFGVEPQVQAIHAEATSSATQQESIHLMPIEDGNYIQVSTRHSSASLQEPVQSSQEKGKERWDEPKPVPSVTLVPPSQAVTQRSQWNIMVDSFQRLFGLHPEFFPNLKQAIVNGMSRVSVSTRQAYRNLLSAVEEGYQRALGQSRVAYSSAASTTSTTRGNVAQAVSDVERMTVAAIDNLTQAVQDMFHQRPPLSCTPRHEAPQSVSDALWNLTSTAVGGVNMATRRFHKDLKSAQMKYYKMVQKNKCKRYASSASTSGPMPSYSEKTGYASSIPPTVSSIHPATSMNLEQSYPINYPYGQVQTVSAPHQQEQTLYPDLTEKSYPFEYPATESTIATLPRYSTRPRHESPDYQYQLQTLESMGFLDGEVNYILLKQCQGDLNKVISFLSS